MAPNVSFDERLRRLLDFWWWLGRVRRPWARLNARLSPGVTPGEPARAIFVIKLISKADARSWPDVEKRLEATLASIGRQQGALIDIVICGQDRPATLDCLHPVHFVKAPSRLRRIEGVDRQAKQRLALRSIVERFDGPAYLFFIDADDVAHPDLVSYVASDRNGRGYHIDDGWMWKAGTNDLVRLSKSSSGMPFHEMCGSCLVMAVDLDRKALASRILNALPQNHQILWQHLADLGQPPDTMPFPAMIYVVGHTDNASSRFGRDGARGWLFADHAETDERARTVLSEFQIQLDADHEED